MPSFLEVDKGLGVRLHREGSVVRLPLSQGFLLDGSIELEYLVLIEVLSFKERVVELKGQAIRHPTAFV